MTEADWLAATDPEPMLAFLRGKVSDRKLRLLAIACCHRFWSMLPDDIHRSAVETAERFADGQVTDDERDFWYQESHEICWNIPGDRRDLHEAARAACNTVETVVDDPLPYLPSICQLGYCSEEIERQAQIQLLRDIVGNPFRPVALDPAWRTEAVVALAAGIYADRAFDRLPVLADALEDAGCADAEVLGHCRGPGPHVRGCWAVDLLLGKT